MSSRSTPISPNEYYHVYNRGVEKRDIFLDTQDYQRFLDLLFVCNSTTPISIRDIYRTYNSVYEYERINSLVSVGAYCLMPNHFHMLLTSDLDNGITLFMNKVSTGYAMYFNRKYDRTGSLFQGKFKSEHACRDEYLKYLYAYIHLNPVKLIQSDWKEVGIKNAGIAFEYCKTYKYSSLKEYIDKVEIKKRATNPGPFPEYFCGSEDHERELFDWLTYD